MKIIITGGGGLIGSALAANLAQDRHSVVVTSRAPDQLRGLPAGVRAVRWDARTARGWGGEADGADAIVNLAGEPIAPMPWLGDRKAKIRTSRVQAGQAVVDAVQQAKNKPRVVVQSSAIGYYGPRGDETLTEASPPGADFLASVCRDWEAATAPVERMGVRRAVYRTGLVLARRDGILPLMALPFTFFVGGKLGSGKQWMSWIHLADEIAAIRFLLDHDAARGAFNFTAPNPVRNQEFSQALGQALHRPSAIPVPGFALKLPFGEMADLLLLNGQRVVPAALSQLGFQFRYPTLTQALQNLYG